MNQTPELDHNDLVGNTDATQWARHFLQVSRFHEGWMDEALLTTWFANAIMAGYDKAKNEVSQADNVRLPDA